MMIESMNDIAVYLNRGCVYPGNQAIVIIHIYYMILQSWHVKWAIPELFLLFFASTDWYLDS